jgi:hypothetical protein
MSIAFGAPGNQVVASANVHTYDIFTKVDKSPDADTAMVRDNDNEVISKRRTNKTMQLTFSCKLRSTTLALALAECAAIPLKDDVGVITCAGDAQIAGTAYVESATGSYTPDNEFVLDLVVRKFSKTFAVAA